LLGLSHGRRTAPSTTGPRQAGGQLPRGVFRKDRALRLRSGGCPSLAHAARRPQKNQGIVSFFGLSQGRRTAPSTAGPRQAGKQLPRGVPQGSRASFAVLGGCPSLAHAARRPPKTRPEKPRNSSHFSVSLMVGAPPLLPRDSDKQVNSYRGVFQKDRALRLWPGECLPPPHPARRAPKTPQKNPPK
jgi:hypothetical protein